MGPIAVIKYFMAVQKVYTYGIYISKAEFLQLSVYIYRRIFRDVIVYTLLHLHTLSGGEKNKTK